MKFKIVLVFLSVYLILSSINLFSQDKAFKLGFLANCNFYRLKGDKVIIQGEKGRKDIGFSPGIFVRKFLTKKIYGNVEFRYISKGTMGATLYYNGIKLNYIEIPFTAGYQFNFLKNRMFVEAGVAYAKLLSLKIFSQNTSMNPEFLREFKKNDLSLLTKIIYPLKIKNSDKFFIAFRFSHSIQSIHNNFKIYNLNYGIELDYLFK